MKTVTPMHAERELAHVAQRFDHWRQHRPTPRPRIPQSLWDQAVALTAVLPISRMAKRLRLSMHDLKKHCAATPALCAAKATPVTPGFVEVSAAAGLAAPRPAYRDRPPARRWRTPPDSGARVAVPHHSAGADVSGDHVMLQLTPQSRIFVATEPVDFRKGINGLAAVCRRALGDNPLSGALYPRFKG